MKRIFLFLLLSIFLCTPAYAQFPLNPILLEDGTIVEGAGRRLDIRDDISVTYDSITEAYKIDAAVGSGGTNAAAGNDTEIQFNDGGTDLGGDSDLIWNKTTNTMTVGGTASILAGSGSSGVLTLGGVGNTNNENLTYDFETTADSVTIASTTGVSNINITPYIIVGGASAGQSIIAAGLTVNDDSGGGANDDFIAESNSQALAFQVDASADEINVNVVMVLEHVTSDPCTAGEPEGGIFWNATASEACVCDGTNDVRLTDASTACF